jgi:hypothetical protein
MKSTLRDAPGARPRAGPRGSSRRSQPRKTPSDSGSCDEPERDEAELERLEPDEPDKSDEPESEPDVSEPDVDDKEPARPRLAPRVAPRAPVATQESRDARAVLQVAVVVDMNVLPVLLRSLGADLVDMHGLSLPLLHRYLAAHLVLALPRHPP